MNWKMEVSTDNSGAWNSNSCVYATEGEAMKAGEELMSRWLLVRDYRAVESDETVNYKFENGRNTSLKSEESC